MMDQTEVSMTKRPLMRVLRVRGTGSTHVVAAVALATVGCLSTTTYAQSVERSVWDGVFTEAQATRGERTYEQECATCHLADLLGDGIAPALKGAAFDFRWSDLSVGDIFVTLRATMPQGAPASLSPQGYADVVSYILKVNGFPAGDTELPTSEATLNEIIVKADQAGSTGAQAEDSGSAQTDGASAWDGVFTAAQAARGESAYEQECATCHLADLLGDGIAPSLKGAAFDFRWSDLSVGNMFVAIRATMPQGAPASLSPQRYADIVSYLLQVNDFPAGENELPTDEATLNEIIIKAEKP